ncbi:MAG: blue (type 1) copper domain protein [Frankiales bacterium]|nr:blue (type 1) copper domain protein [Frankiales bacterium]
MTTPRTAARLLLLAVPLLALAGCGGGGSSSEGEGSGSAGAGVAAAGPADAQTATVVGNARLQFAPETVTAAPGTLKLTLKVEGGVPHNLEFDDAAVGAPIPTIDGEQTGTYVFSKAGTYDFVCTLHGGMEGQVVVAAP